MINWSKHSEQSSISGEIAAEWNVLAVQVIICHLNVNLSFLRGMER